MAFTEVGVPHGCLIASAAISCSPAAVDVQLELRGVRSLIEQALRVRIEDDMRTGALPPDTDAATLAAFTTTLIQGMSTIARDGAPRERVVAVAKAAMAVWQ